MSFEKFTHLFDLWGTHMPWSFGSVNFAVLECTMSFEKITHITTNTDNYGFSSCLKSKQLKHNYLDEKLHNPA